MSGKAIYITVLISCLLGVESFPRQDSSLGIAGGHAIDITEVPFMARFYVLLSIPCGAAIVHESFLISSGYCYYENIVWNITMHVKVGTDKTNSGGETHDVADGFLHPDFVISKYDYDISLLKLTKPLKFNEKIKPIPMAKKGFVVPEKAIVDIMGFGSTTGNIFDPKIPDQLQKVSVPALLADKCQILVKDVTENMICAGALGKGGCFGDDGGPLTYEDKLVGVLSSDTCGQRHQPNIYAYIPVSRDFIDSTISANA